MGMINVQLQPDSEITQMDECDLVKRTGQIDNDDEFTTWVEYRLASDPNAEWAVHRSAHVTLKKPALLAAGAIGNFGN